MEANRSRDDRAVWPSYHDQFAGAYAVIGMLAAMLQANQAQAAAPVEVGLYETAFTWLPGTWSCAAEETTAGRPEREPHGEFSMPGYGAYQTSTSVDLSADAQRHPLAPSPARPELHRMNHWPHCANAKRHVRESRSGEGGGRGHTFDAVAAQLKAAGVGFTEVLPLERVLDAPQARHPGKLATCPFRDFAFDVPEFPACVQVRMPCRLNSSGPG